MKKWLALVAISGALFAQPAFAETKADESKALDLMCGLSSTMNGLVAYELLSEKDLDKAEKLRQELLQKSQSNFHEKFPDDAETRETLSQFVEMMVLPAKQIQELTSKYGKEVEEPELLAQLVMESSKRVCVSELKFTSQIHES